MKGIREKRKGSSSPDKAPEVIRWRHADAPWLPRNISIVKLLAPKSLWRLEIAARDGEYIAPSELADVIAANPDQSLPEALRDYLCRVLRGEVKKKRGRKSVDGPVTPFILSMIAADYGRELSRVKERRGANKRDTSKTAKAPHEIAIANIKNRYPKLFGNMSDRRVANILSARKFGR